MNARPAILVHSPSWTGLAPAEKDGALFLSGADGRFRAYDKSDGSLKWVSPVTEESEHFRVGDRYLVSTGLDSISAHDTEDGQILWSRAERMSLEGLTDEAVLASKRGEIHSLDRHTGKTIWQADTHQPALPWNGKVLTVEGERDRRETLLVRDIESGTPLWQTSDGDIQHLVPFGERLLYSATKFGRHHQEVQRVSSRGPEGAMDWTFRCSGALRVPPQPSPDGERIALLQKDPSDSSRSVLSILDPQGQLIYEVPAALKADIAFSDEGNVILSETEFSPTPGQEETRLRCLDPQGKERWSRPGKADWMTSGSQLIVSQGTSLTALDQSTGAVKWNISFSGPLAPLTLSDEKLRVSGDGCSLTTLDIGTGRVLETVSTGDTLFFSPDGPIADHEGRIWTDTLRTEHSSFVGDWKLPKPFHISIKSAPTTRGGKAAVYLDWDGDENDDGTDPVLLDANRELVSWQQLQTRDTDQDKRLNNPELTDLNLWFDSDGDGKVSSEAEFRPLLDSSFDKGRVELENQLLWLASDSRCPS